MVNLGAYYPKLMKEFMVNNDRIPHGLLNFSYKLFVGKYVLEISLPNVTVIDKFGLSGDEDMSKVAYMFMMVKIRKAPIHEAKDLQKIIVILTTIKGVCEGILKMLSLHTSGYIPSLSIIAREITRNIQEN